MSPTLKHTVAAAMLLVLYASIHVGQSSSPSIDPVEVGLVAAVKSMAANGWHDVDGQRFPVLAHVSKSKWFLPVPIYATALTMKVSGALGAAADPLLAARTAAAVMGCLDVLLVYFIAARVFRNAALAFAAALMVLFSPAHAMFSRLASEDGIWQLTFIALWLAGLVEYAEASDRSSRWMLAISAASLAASIYAQPSAGVMIPWFGLATVDAVRRTRGWDWRHFAVAAAAAACAVLPLGVWFARHPLTYVDTFGAWALHPAYIRNPLEWARAWSNIQTLSVTANAFWDFFSPSHLFLKSAAETGARAPVLLAVPGFLLVGGLVELARGGRALETPRARMNGRLAALGFVIGPLGAATFKQPWAIQRTVVLVIFGALLATIGLSALWTWIRTPIAAAAHRVRRAPDEQQFSG